VFNFLVRLEVMPIQIKVGGVYLNHCGHRVTITRKDSLGTFVSIHDVLYDKFGGCIYHDRICDIVSVVSEPDESVPEVMSIQLKDGGVYACEDGLKYKVHFRDNPDGLDYPWIDQNGTTYTDSGRYYKYDTPSTFDLIRVVSEPGESVPEVVVTEYTVKEVVRLKKEIDDWIRLYKSMNTRDFLAEIAALETDRDNWKKACLAQVELRHSALKEAAGWRKICEGHALRLEALGEKP
jgi:hypothetical protein